MAGVLSENSWSAATPRRHLTRRDEGCPLVLRYAVWREKIACAPFLSGYAEVAGCGFVKGRCRDVRQSFFSITLVVLQQRSSHTQGVIGRTENAVEPSDPSRDIAGLRVWRQLRG